MDEVRRLQDNFLGAGGSNAVFEELGRGRLGLGDTGLQDGSFRSTEARDVAERCLQDGKLMEYHCYDHRGRSQGMAVLRFVRWTVKGVLKFKADHVVASDAYYEWWASNVVDPRKVVYHICEVLGDSVALLMPQMWRWST